MAVSKMLLVDMLAGRPEIHSHHQKTADCSQGPVPRVCFGDRPEMKMHRGRKKPVFNTPLPVNCLEGGRNDQTCILIDTPPIQVEGLED